MKRISPIDLRYVLVLPVVLLLLIFTIYPFIFQIYLSFTGASIRNYMTAPLIGLQNYSTLLVNPGHFWSTMRVTVLFVAIVVSAELLLGLAMALLVFPLTSGVRTIVTLLVLPMLATPVFLGAIGRLVFHSIVGVVPYYFKAVGLPAPMMSDPAHALLAVAILDIWQWTPFMFLISHAGLQAIPTEVLDAAQVDGASGLNQLRYVILPLLRLVLSVAIIFRTMDAFKTFDIPYILSEGGPGAPVGATTTVSVLTYKLMLTYDQFGQAAALVVLLLVVMNLTINRLSKYLLGR